MRNVLGLAFLLILAACQSAGPGNPTPGPPTDEAPTGPPRLGEVRAYATLHSAGFEWQFSADPEARATCGLKYRAVGETAWHEAWPPYRIQYAPPSPVAGKDEAFDGCAGSVFFLQPGTRYQLWLSLTGPEGLLDEGIVEVATQSEPKIAPGAPSTTSPPAAAGARAPRPTPTGASRRRSAMPAPATSSC